MMTKERLDEITRNGNHLACVSESAIEELVEAARESIRLQAENAKLRKHAEAMEAEIFNLSAYDSNDAVIAFRADFPKEPDK